MPVAESRCCSQQQPALSASLTSASTSAFESTRWPIETAPSRFVVASMAASRDSELAGRSARINPSSRRKNTTAPTRIAVP